MIRTGSGAIPYLAVAGMAAALLLSGCVFIRLLELKHQLADFDRNFAVATDNGVRIICRNPVLLSEDIRWLGLAPEKVRKLGQAEAWQVRWVKQLPPGVHESGAFDIVIELFFADDKLTRVAIPERYFTLMPKQFLLDLIRSLGGAKVDRDRRSIEAQLAVARPDLPAILKILGRPTAESSKEGQTIRRYRYVPAASAAAAHAAIFDMTVYFDDATGDLIRWQGRTPAGDIGFNFSKHAKP